MYIGSDTRGENIVHLLLWLLHQPGENTFMAAVLSRRGCVVLGYAVAAVSWALWFVVHKDDQSWPILDIFCLGIGWLYVQMKWPGSSMGGLWGCFRRSVLKNKYLLMVPDLQGSRSG